MTRQRWPESRPVWNTVLTASLALAVLTSTGCDDTEDFDHDPPTGQGSLVIDNNGPEDVDVYVDGQFVREVGDEDWEALDYPSGLYRVVLVEDDTERTFSDDVDILENRLTILDVESSGSSSGYLPVTVRID